MFGNTTYNNLTIANNTFNNIVGGTYDPTTAIIFVPVFSSSLLENINIMNNIFTGLTNSGIAITTNFIGPFPPTINNWNMINNVFTSIADNSAAINLSFNVAGSTEMAIADNTFVGTNPNNTGYATSVNLWSGDLCLQLLSNNATPLTSPDPYQLTNSGGTFNDTVANNVGNVDTSGVIGSC
jgi:hypothetical protein